MRYSQEMWNFYRAAYNYADKRFAAILLPYVANGINYLAKQVPGIIAGTVDVNQIARSVILDIIYFGIQDELKRVPTLPDAITNIKTTEGQRLQTFIPEAGAVNAQLKAAGGAEYINVLSNLVASDWENLVDEAAAMTAPLGASATTGS
jgi:hypothetical protein